MATGGARRPGAALGLVLLLAGAVPGCGASDTAGDTPAPRTASPPAPRTTPPEELCARIVAHWSREVLDDDHYGDYQSMGLSNGQYEILRAVVDAARAERKRQGRAAAEQLIDRQARERCTERYRDGGPTGGPWT